MKKICLTVVGLYLMFLHAFSQVSTKDSSAFKSRRLKLDEVNLVSSYYNQTADKSAVSGGDPGPSGIGNVTDLAGGLDVKFVAWDAKGRKNNLGAGLGIDHHTAASQAYVSLDGTAKNDGTRIYPTLNWSIENEKKGTSFGLGAYYSAEHDYYHSIGLDVSFSKKTNNNGEFSVKLNGYFDRIKMIIPTELIPKDTAATAPPSGTTTIYTTASGRTVELSSSGEVLSESAKPNIPSSSRDSYSASFSFSQVINARMQGSIILDMAYQNGYLGLPFHRVYFADSSNAAIEKLPSRRFKLPFGIRLNYFLGDYIILRTYYRFYIDNWGLTSHTANIEVPVKITPFFSISPFYRFYTQTAVNYFAPYQAHHSNEEYYTSNYALSAFSSNFFGMGFRLAPPNGILGISVMEIRYGHYTQTTDLSSDIISISLKFKK